MANISKIEIDDTVYDIKDEFARENITTFATPEQYGAVGDGVTDDKVAIQNCFNSDAKLIVMNKDYYVSDSVVFKGRNREIFGTGKIICDHGTNSALVINGDNLVIDILEISSPNCITISTIEQDYNWSQYITFKNIDLIATDTCVKCIRNATKWINEIKFDNVRFSGLVGLSLNGDSSNSYNYGGYKFINCGNETCTNYFIKAYNLNDLSIVNLRNNEAWQYPLISIDNDCNYFEVIGPALYDANQIFLNNSKTNKGIIVGNVVSGGARYTSISKCYNGAFTTDTDNYTVLTGTNDTYTFVGNADHFLPTTYILRSAAGAHTYTINVPEFYLKENEFYIINQSIYNSLVLNYGTHTKTASLSRNGTYKVSFKVDTPYLQNIDETGM